MYRTKLTPDLAGALCDARRNGASCEEAASIAGVHPDSISRWRRFAKSGKPIFAMFAQMWSEAEKQSEQAVADALRKVYA